MTASTLAPGSTPPAPSGPPLRLDTALGPAFAAYLRVIGDAGAVSSQQDLALTLFPTLPQDQALARSHAANWIVDAAPPLLIALTAVAGHARVLRAYAPALRAHADDIDAGHGDVAQFGLLCAALRSHTGHQTASLASTRRDFQLYRQSVRDDGVRFGDLSQRLPAAYAVDLIGLQKTLGALQERLAEDNRVIANAAASLIPGVLAIGIAAGLAVLDVAQAKVVLQKGWTVLTGAVKAADDAMTDADAAIVDYGTTLTTLSAVKAELAVFTTVAGAVSRLTVTTTDAITALDTLATGWHDEDGFLVWLTALAQGAATGSRVRAEVDELLTRWQRLGAAADDYLAASVDVSLSL